MVDFAKLLEQSRARRAALEACPPIVVIDLETTGFDPWADRMFQLAACRIEKGRVLGTRSWYVNTEGVSVPAKNLERSGVRRSDVENAPPFWQVFNELVPWLEGAEIGAYHASFDRAFLLASVARTWPRSAFASVPSVLSRPWLDPLPLIWHYCPPPFSLRLGDVVRHLGLRGPHGFRAHHAMDDAAATADILLSLFGGWTHELLPLKRFQARQAELAPQREVHRWVEKEGIQAWADRGGISVKRDVPLAQCDACSKYQVLDWTRSGAFKLRQDRLPEGWVQRGEQTLCGTACDFVHAWWTR